MYYCLVSVNDEKLENEIGIIINQFKDIKIQYFQFPYDIIVNQKFLNCLFILITDINPYYLNALNNVKSQVPDIPVVFYNHSLVVSNLQQMGDTSGLNMIVGENRKRTLSELIQSSQDGYWRKIPYHKFSIDFDNLSFRLKKALHFIENTEINQCKTEKIASLLNISPGYFSQEFKRETGQSFRNFMQKLLNHYEELIITRVNMPTKDIAEILGYSELSSFSRSFKIRKGISPKKYKKQIA
ncbi:MAG: AraC family transcriptional regulator [Calditrichaceae bacterium]